MPGILLSQTIIDTYGDDILAALPRTSDARLVAIDADNLPDQATLESLEAAYLSVDMFSPHPANRGGRDMPAFFDTLLAAPNLRWLHICSAGTDRAELAQVARRGAAVTHSSGANAAAVAHVAIAGMLALARNVPMWVRAQDARRWHPQRHAETPADLDGTTAVVVGLGEIGRRIAKACRALDMRVIGVRRHAGPDENCDAVVSPERLPEVASEAQWLILACPLTNETRNLVDGALIARMPQGARIINIGRGGVINEDDLLAALRSGTLAGAYLDVFATEPLPADSPLWDAPNLLISAHSGGASRGFSPRATAVFLDNLGRWSRGEALRNLARFDG